MTALKLRVARALMSMARRLDRPPRFDASFTGDVNRDIASAMAFGERQLAYNIRAATEDAFRQAKKRRESE